MIGGQRTPHRVARLGLQAAQAPARGLGGHAKAIDEDKSGFAGWVLELERDPAGARGNKLRRRQQVGRGAGNEAAPFLEERHVLPDPRRHGGRQAVTLDADGDYAFWVRSRDFAQDRPKMRRFALRVNAVPFEQEAGTHGREGFAWQRLGRRTLLYIGSFGYIASLGLTGWAFFSGTYALVPACIFAFLAAHAVGQGAVIWVFISEIFPNEHRASGQSLGSFTHWIFAALLTTFFPKMVASFHPGSVFLFFAGMMVLQLLWVKLMVPETKGVPLEELEGKLATEA